MSPPHPDINAVHFLVARVNPPFIIPSRETICNRNCKFSALGDDVSMYPLSSLKVHIVYRDYTKYYSGSNLGVQLRLPLGETIYQDGEAQRRAVLGCRYEDDLLGPLALSLGRRPRSGGYPIRTVLLSLINRLSASQVYNIHL